MTPLILASASPRRAALLRQIGVAFEVRPADADESQHPGESPESYVERLAQTKARSVCEPERLSLGADTAVVLDGRIFGKPADLRDGVDMLMALSGRTHQVVTGVALLAAERGEVLHVTSHVEFRRIGRDEAQVYWRTGEPGDKAGGYGIQGIGGIFAQSIRGSYSAIVGLPLSETEQLLRNFGVDIWRGRDG